MKKIVIAGLLLSSAAFAKGAASPQPHHAQANGLTRYYGRSSVTSNLKLPPPEVSKTHQESTKAGGK